MEQAIRRLKRYGDLCLVAGAAEGLGRAFAEAFAACGLGLILVDRDRDKLEILKSDLTERAVPVRCVHLDLSTVDSAGVLMEIIRETGCRMLVYNAAFSKVQPFLSNSPADLQQYVNVNVSTPLQLVHSFCSFHSGKPGSPKGIILMSSMAGGWGNALLAPYGATKAFIHILAEALYHELKQDGFDILSSITGATRTPGYLASSPDHTGMPLKLMEPADVVSACLHSLGKKPFVVPGRMNMVTWVIMSRVLPRRISLQWMNRTVGRVYRHVH